MSKVTTEIQVTWDDIYSGRRANPFRCPIALAAKRAFNTGDDTDLWATSSTLKVDERNYPMPASASDFLKKFDRGDCVMPFSFSLVSWEDAKDLTLTITKRQADALASLLYRGVGGSMDGPRGSLTSGMRGSVSEKLEMLGADRYGVSSVKGLIQLEN